MLRLVRWCAPARSKFLQHSSAAAWQILQTFTARPIVATSGDSVRTELTTNLDGWASDHLFYFCIRGSQNGYRGRLSSNARPLQ
jgi:hypothetical protein